MVFRVVLSVTSQWSQPRRCCCNSARVSGLRVVDQIVEQREKLSAGHFLAPFFLRK